MTENSYIDVYLSETIEKRDNAACTIALTLILHSGEECADTVCLHADVPVFVLKTKHPL